MSSDLALFSYAYLASSYFLMPHMYMDKLNQASGELDISPCYREFLRMTCYLSMIKQQMFVFVNHYTKHLPNVLSFCLFQLLYMLHFLHKYQSNTWRSTKQHFGSDAGYSQLPPSPANKLQQPDMILH